MPTSTRRAALLSAVRSIQYLLGPFRFPTDQAAPLPSPYSEAGEVGALTLVQNDGQFSVSGGKLVFPAQSTPGWGDLGLYSSTGLSRIVGRAILGTLNFGLSNQDCWFGWSGTAANNGTNGLDTMRSASTMGVSASATLVAVGASYSAGTDYQVAVVLRSIGCFYLIKGGVYTNWTLFWVSNSGTTTPVYPAFSVYTQSGTLDDFRVTDLPAPFNTDYGLATSRLTSPGAGATFSHTADCLWEVTATPAGGSSYFVFRKQDSNNYWRIAFNTSNFTLQEVVAGTPVTRASDASANSGSIRLVVVADGSVIKGYKDNVLKWTYSSATNFSAQTAGEVNTLAVGASVSECVAWPRVTTLPNV